MLAVIVSATVVVHVRSPVRVAGSNIERSARDQANGTEEPICHVTTNQDISLNRYPRVLAAESVRIEFQLAVS